MPEYNWKPIRVPSFGRFYDSALPNGEVYIREYTTEDEATLATNAGDAMGRINRLIDRCIQLPKDFRYTIPNTTLTMQGNGALLTTDAFFLLVAQRNLTYGGKCTISFNCRYCQAQNNGAAVDLEKDVPIFGIDEKEADAAAEGLPTPFVEPFEVMLPRSGQTVFIRHSRRLDELAQTSRQRAASSDKLKTAAYYANITSLVVGVKEIENWHELADDRKYGWLAKLPAMDSKTIGAALEKRQSGMNPNVNLDCSACGRVNEVGVLSDPTEFFQPAND